MCSVTIEDIKDQDIISHIFNCNRKTEVIGTHNI